MKFLLILIIFSQNFQKSFILEGFPQSYLEYKIDNLSKKNLLEWVNNYPNCDFFYIPFLKEKKIDILKDYFLKAGSEPLILLYFLRNYENFQETLNSIKIDKLELLKRFLWAMQNESQKKNCPEGINIKRPKVLGFQDEISPSCYSFFLLYSTGEYKDSIDIHFENEFTFETQREEILKLMQKYKIPLLHRNIIQNLPKEIKKLKGSN